MVVEAVEVEVVEELVVEVVVGVGKDGQKYAIIIFPSALSCSKHSSLFMKSLQSSNFVSINKIKLCAFKNYL
jgi:hypothetical protein